MAHSSIEFVNVDQSISEVSVWLLKQDGLGDSEGASLRGSVAATGENDSARVVHSECLAKHGAIGIFQLSEVFLLLPVAFIPVE